MSENKNRSFIGSMEGFNIQTWVDIDPVTLLPCRRTRVDWMPRAASSPAPVELEENNVFLDEGEEN